jgi:hypothetical protein
MVLLQMELRINVVLCKRDGIGKSRIMCWCVIIYYLSFVGFMKIKDWWCVTMKSFIVFLAVECKIMSLQAQNGHAMLNKWSYRNRSDTETRNKTSDTKVFCYSFSLTKWNTNVRYHKYVLWSRDY